MTSRSWYVAIWLLVEMVSGADMDFQVHYNFGPGKIDYFLAPKIGDE